MRSLPNVCVLEAFEDSPCLPQRECADPWDFGDMRTLGKPVVVCGDESYRGIFLGRNLRLGYVVGVLGNPDSEEQAILQNLAPGKNVWVFAGGESFRTLEDLHSRWMLAEGVRS